MAVLEANSFNTPWSRTLREGIIWDPKLAAPRTFQGWNIGYIDKTANTVVTTVTDSKQVLYRTVGNSSYAPDNDPVDTKMVLYRAIGNSTLTADNYKQDTRVLTVNENRLVNNLALNKPYTLSKAPVSGHADTGGKLFTDGVQGATNFSDGKSFGYESGAFGLPSGGGVGTLDITVDLGGIFTVNKARLASGSSSNDGLGPTHQSKYEADQLEVLVSKDNTTFTPVGKIGTLNVPTSYLTLSFAPTLARYVTFRVSKQLAVAGQYGDWLFIEEGFVYSEGRNEFQTTKETFLYNFPQMDTPYAFDEPQLGVITRSSQGNVQSTFSDNKEVLYREQGNSTYSPDNNPTDAKQVLYRAQGNSTYGADNQPQDTQIRLVAESGTPDQQNRFEAPWTTLLSLNGSYIHTNKQNAPNRFDGPMWNTYIEKTPNTVVTTLIDSKQILFREIGNSTFAGDNNPISVEEVLFREIGYSTYAADNNSTDTQAKLLAANYFPLPDNRFEITRPINLINNAKILGGFEYNDVGFIMLIPHGNYQTITDVRARMIVEGNVDGAPVYITNNFDSGVTATLFGTANQNAGTFEYGLPSQTLVALGNPQVVSNADSFQHLGQTWTYLVDTKENIIQEANKPIRSWQGFESLNGGMIPPFLVPDHMISPLFEDEMGTNAITNNWTQRVFIGGASVQYLTDAFQGSYVRLTGYQWYGSKAVYSFDPTKMYRIRVRVRRPTNAETGKNAKFYIGVEGYLADGVTYCNYAGQNSWGSQHYFDAVYADPSTDWMEYVSYIKGNSPAGSNADSSRNTSPSNPGKLHANAKFFSPLFIANYDNSVQGVTDIAYEVVEVVGTPPQSKMNSFEYPSAQVGLAFYGNGTVFTTTTDTKQVLFREFGNSSLASDNPKPDMKQVLYRAIGNSTYVGDNNKQDVTANIVSVRKNVLAPNRFDSPHNRLMHDKQVYVYGKYFSPETFDDDRSVYGLQDYIEYRDGATISSIVDAKQVLYREVGNSSYAGDNRNQDTRQILYRAIGNSTYLGDNNKQDTQAKLVGAGYYAMPENRFEIAPRRFNLIVTSKILGTFDWGMTTTEEGNSLLNQVPHGNYSQIVDAQMRLVAENANGTLANNFDVGIPTTLYNNDRINVGTFGYGTFQAIPPLMHPVVISAQDTYQKLGQTWTFKIDTNENIVGVSRRPEPNTFESNQMVEGYLYMKGGKYAAPQTFEKPDPFTVIEKKPNTVVTTVTDTKLVLFRQIGNSSFAGDNNPTDTKAVLYRAIGNSTYAGDNIKQDTQVKLASTYGKIKAFDGETTKTSINPVLFNNRYTNAFERPIMDGYLMAPPGSIVVNVSVATRQGLTSPGVWLVDARASMTAKAAVVTDVKATLTTPRTIIVDTRVWLGINVTTLTDAKQTLLTTVGTKTDTKQVLVLNPVIVVDNKQVITNKANVIGDAHYVVTNKAQVIADTKQIVFHRQGNSTNASDNPIVDTKQNVVAVHRSAIADFEKPVPNTIPLKFNNTFEYPHNGVLVAPPGGKAVTIIVATNVSITNPGTWLVDIRSNAWVPVTVTVDSKQGLLTTVSTKTDTKETIYANPIVNTDTKMVLRINPTVLTDVKAAIAIPNSGATITTQQVIYRPQTVISDTKQAIKATSIVNVDTKQVMYAQRNVTTVDVKEVMYVPVSTPTDTKAVIHAKFANTWATEQVLSVIQQTIVDTKQNESSTHQATSDVKVVEYAQNTITLVDTKQSLVEIVAPTVITPTANGSTINKRPTIHIQSNDYAGKTLTARVRFYSDSSRVTLVHTATSASFASGAKVMVSPTVDLPVQTVYATVDLVLAGGTSYGPFVNFQFTINNTPWSDTVTDSAPGIRAVWLNDLANVINELRTFRGLSLTTFTDGTLVGGMNDVRRLYFTERRTALTEALATINAPSTWQTASLDATTDKKGILVNELRNALKQG